ncbi:double-cubane-cluster-containing anaerobic reductase [Faecalicatena contorta]|uniref:double-cubane-cluster-containing anaerobic reductase n=1 Tax=Faecalicatena contorta TaxID=39482 RepID=UPI002E1F8097|nr:2-hydroxyacyl-CoA dehydratase [Faecalicatena contorta]
MKLVKNLPEVFEEFGEKRRKAFLEIKEYKEKGVPVVGMYCAYFPTELAMAVGAIPVGLCSFADETVKAAERELPKSMCPLVKSSYGFAVEDKCPFFHFADLVIGETTCDGKKKMYELMAEFKPVFVMELPNSQSKSSLKFWEQEIIRTKEYFEEFFNVIITDEMLKDSIHLGNQIRHSLKKLCEVMKLDPAPVYGADIQKMITGSKYRFDFHSTPEVVDAVTDKIMEEYQEGKMLEHRPRILVTGCPMGGDTMKIIEAIEENGGVVVAVENCSGVKTLDQMIDEDNDNLYEAIAKRYLATGCSIMTPNDNRIELLGRLVDEYHVDGVVEMILTGCHSTGAESIYIRKFMNEEKNIPYLAITTDYSRADYGQISTRVAALLEMIAAEKEEIQSIDINQCYQLMLSGLVKEKTMTDVLCELYEYTGISVAILNTNEEIVAYSGSFDSEKGYTYSDIIETRLKDGSGRIIARSNEEHLHVEIKEFLHIIEKAYSIRKERGLEKKKNSFSEIEQAPDYLWVIAEKHEDKQDIPGEIREKFRIMKITEQEDCLAYLFSNVQGQEARNLLIRLWSDYAKAEDVRIVIGNGFDDVQKSLSNRKMIERLFAIISDTEVSGKAYLLEDYYQEVIFDFVADKIEIDNYRLEELERIKEEDEKYGSNLYETLYWYLLMKRNTLQTAAKLKIHRNTLLNRISKINEIIDISDKSGMECERLLMAMQLERIIK